MAIQLRTAQVPAVNECSDFNGDQRSHAAGAGDSQTTDLRVSGFG